MIALVAGRSDEFFEAVLAVKLSLLLDEADVLEASTTLAVDADKVLGAPDLSQGRDEWPSEISQVSYRI